MKSKRNYKTWMELGYSEDDAKFEARKRMPGTYEYFRYFKGFGEDESKKLVDEWKDKNLKRTKKRYVEKFGKEEGLKRWNEYRRKQSISNSFEYKRDKYGWTKEEFEKFNKSRAVTEDNMIKKYGAMEGKKKWVSYIERQRFTCTIEYFIEEYGEELGTKKYNEFCYIRDNVIKQKRLGLRSKVSEELFSIIDSLTDDYCFWGDNEFKFIKKTGGCFHVDFFNQRTGKVIEFFGDVFHANPKLYKDENEVLFFGKSVREVREKDKRRIKMLSEYDIVSDVHIVWEREYRRNKAQVISYCMEFINE